MIESLVVKFLTSVGSGSIVGFILVFFSVYTGVLIYCFIKIKSQCKSITAMSAAMKEKVEEKEFNKEMKEMKENIEKMDKRNILEHTNLTESSTKQLEILSFLKGKASND
jgi:hypothetical protein